LKTSVQLQQVVKNGFHTDDMMGCFYSPGS